MTAATMPPMSIQTALSVGEPVKNRDTSELNDEQSQRNNFIHKDLSMSFWFIAM
jgi:hypothetical protein